MKIRILNLARLELLDAKEYYNSERAGLGFEFAAEFKNTILRIAGFPDTWSRLSSRARRCLMNRFPYAVIYEYNHEIIRIIAVMHMRRDPKNWQQRI
jgi:secreted Zn-dependent insulinase-like peptidase